MREEPIHERRAMAVLRAADNDDVARRDVPDERNLATMRLLMGRGIAHMFASG